MYSTELTGEDIQYCIAAVVGVVRRSHEKQDEQKAIEVTAAAAEVISRLNHGTLNTIDVRFINTCIEKTREFLLTDRGLPHAQRMSAREWGERIQNKLAGVGAERVVFNG